LTAGFVEIDAVVTDGVLREAKGIAEFAPLQRSEYQKGIKGCRDSPGMNGGNLFTRPDRRSNDPQLVTRMGIRT
jgi:hypothetical protein